MIIKDGAAIMIKGSYVDIIEDLVAICYSIHKQFDIPKEVLAGLIAKSLAQIGDNDAFIKSIDLTNYDKKNDSIFPDDFPSEEFFKFQGCKNEDEYWEKIKNEMISKKHKDPKEVEEVINILKKKFPFPKTAKKETTTEDAKNQFKSMFGDLLNE